jgi:hypothetical protein
MTDSYDARQASLLRWGLTALIFALDCMSPPYVMVPFFYALVLFVGKERNKGTIWTLALVGTALTLVSPLIGVAPVPGYPQWVFWLNRVIAIVELLIAALLAGKQ